MISYNFWVSMSSKECYIYSSLGKTDGVFELGTEPCFSPSGQVRFERIRHAFIKERASALNSLKTEGIDAIETQSSGQPPKGAVTGIKGLKLPGSARTHASITRWDTPTTMPLERRLSCYLWFQHYCGGEVSRYTRECTQ